MTRYFKSGNTSYWLKGTEIIIISEGYKKVNSYRIEEESYLAFMFIVYSFLVGTVTCVSRQVKI